MAQLKLFEIIECFYENMNSIMLGKNLFNALIKILGNDFLNLKEKDIRKYIKGQYENYLIQNENKTLPSNTTPSTMDRNIRNWLSDCYKGIFNNSMKSISRESILTLCFILHLNDIECNKLLLAANQHPLHYGGDAEETIISYCLKNKLDFTSAVNFYSNYIRKVNSGENSILYNNQVPYEERTNIIKNRLQFIETNYSSCEAYKDKNDTFIEKMIFYNSEFSYSSNRTFSTIYQLKNRYSISGEDFINFYNCNCDLKDYNDNSENGNTPFGSFQYIKDAFYSIDNFNSSDVTTQPTRFFVILIAIFSWCKSNLKITLSDFVDEILFSCGFHLLDKKYSEDAFVLEISKFRYDEIIKYDENIVILSNKFKTKKDAFSIIISSYLSKENHILSGYELTKKKQFYIFSN